MSLDWLNRFATHAQLPPIFCRDPMGAGGARGFPKFAGGCQFGGNLMPVDNNERATYGHGKLNKCRKLAVYSDGDR